MNKGINRFWALKGIYTFISTFGVAKVLGKLLVLLLFFMSADEPERYGMLAILIAFENIAITLLNFGQKWVIFRYYEGYEGGDKFTIGNDRFLSTTLSAWMFISFILLSVFALLLWLINLNSFFKIEVNYWFYFFLVYIFLNNLIAFYSSYFMISKQLNSFSGTKIQLNIEKFVFVIAFSAIVADVFIGYIIGVTLATLLTSLIYRRVFSEIKYKFILDKDVIKKNIRYGFPLAAQQVMSTLGVHVDKLFLSQLVSLVDVGIYNFIVTILSVLTFIINICTTYFEPILFRMRKKLRDFLFINKLYLSSVILSCCFTAVFLLVLLCYTDYKQYYAIFIIISIAYIFYALSFYNVYVFMNTDKNLFVLILSAIAFVSDMIANYYFISKYGIYGAAIAFLIYSSILGWGGYFFVEYIYSSFRSRILLITGITSILFMAVVLIESIPECLFILVPIYSMMTCGYIYVHRKRAFLILKDNSK